MRPRRLSSIPAPESAPLSRARLAELSTKMSEIERAMPSVSPPTSDPDEEAVPSTMPTGGWSKMARVLVEMAVHQVVVGELEEARRSANDALLLVDLVDEPRTHAELSLALGDVLVEVSEAARAQVRFEAAIAIFERQHDVRGAARARLSLARAMAALRDPTACAILEDAGTVFEDLGEEDVVSAIDLELREVSAELAPVSFRVPRLR